MKKKLTQQEPIDEEQWARENIEGGTDAHASEEMAEFARQEYAKEQEAKKTQEAKEEKLQEEYFGLSDKMYGDEEFSDEEMEAMEKRQDEILDEVEPIN